MKYHIQIVMTEFNHDVYKRILSNLLFKFKHHIERIIIVFVHNTSWLKQPPLQATTIHARNAELYLKRWRI